MITIIIKYYSRCIIPNKTVLETELSDKKLWLPIRLRTNMTGRTNRSDDEPRCLIKKVL